MPNLKTFAYRTALRQSLEATGWRGCVWTPHILAAECVQGWAGRKNPMGATMLYVYCTKLPTANSIKDMATSLQKAGVPPFNLVPVQDYRGQVTANRLSQGDTQDRFWLLRGYNAVDPSHWDHWLLTQSYWGLYFQPSAQEAMRIIAVPNFFDSMLTQDWNRQEYSGEASAWGLIVAKYHAQWPDYSAMLQLIDFSHIDTEDDFRSTHMSLRAKYLKPKPVEAFDLP